jgi:hypothetical protein
MNVMTDLSIELMRPPAPLPLDAPLGPISTLRALRRNPIETWTKAHFELPIIAGPSILGRIAVVSDPAAIRRIFVDTPPITARIPCKSAYLVPAYATDYWTSKAMIGGCSGAL